MQDKQPRVQVGATTGLSSSSEALTIPDRVLRARTLARHRTVHVLAALLFVAAAVSDVIDGNLARDKDEITRFGQLLDHLGLLSEDRADQILAEIEDQELLAVMEQHREELARRLAAADADPAAGSPWEEVRVRLRDPLE